jgi:hypothetical protein
MATMASGTVSGAAYEDQRRKRVLENLKHLEVTINQTLLFLPSGDGVMGNDSGSSSVDGSPSLPTPLSVLPLPRQFARVLRLICRCC